MIHKILSCGLPLHAIFYSLLMPVSSMIRKMPVSSMIQIKFSYFPCQNLKTHDAVAADSWAWAPGPEPEIFRNLWSWTLEPETCGPELWHLKPVDPSSGTWNLWTWSLEPETCGPELWNLKPLDLSSGTWKLSVRSSDTYGTSVNFGRFRIVVIARALSPSLYSLSPRIAA
jgi:hypothetical protein